MSQIEIGTSLTHDQTKETIKHNYFLTKEYNYEISLMEGGIKFYNDFILDSYQTLYQVYIKFYIKLI